MGWNINFYSDKVVKDLLSLPPDIQGNFGYILDTMKVQGPNLGMPKTKAFGQGLFEIRARGESGIARGFFCTVHGKKIVILHVFSKKTQETPKKDLELAKKRMKEVKAYDI